VLSQPDLTACSHPCSAHLALLKTTCALFIPAHISTDTLMQLCNWAWPLLLLWWDLHRAVVMLIPLMHRHSTLLAQLHCIPCATLFCTADCVAALLPDVCPARRVHLHCEGLLHLRDVAGRGTGSNASSAELPAGPSMSRPATSMRSL
jgi:hypothetical protein